MLLLYCFHIIVYFYFFCFFFFFFFFFFQAEDGIRDRTVTGVQTCDLPIFGYNGSLNSLTDAIKAIPRRRGVDSSPAIAALGVFCLAGADIPIDDRRIAAELEGQGWTRKTIVRNDTFAVLRAGTDRKWGVAVVCGTGMNCAGVGPDGRSVRFPSFGELSGDRAHGGGWLGRSAR